MPRSITFIACLPPYPSCGHHQIWRESFPSVHVACRISLTGRNLHNSQRFMSDLIYDAYWQSGMHLTKEWTPDFFRESLGVLQGKNYIFDYGCGFGYSYQRPLSQSVK